MSELSDDEIVRCAVQGFVLKESEVTRLGYLVLAERTRADEAEMKLAKVEVQADFWANR